MPNENKIESDAFVGQPPADIFEDKHIIETSHLGKGQKFFVVEKVTYPPEGGIFAYFKGMPFPSKGFPTPEALHGNDIVKKNLRLILDMVAQKQMILPIAGFMLLRWKTKMKIVERYMQNMTSISNHLQSAHYLKPDKYTPAAREVNKFVAAFLAALGISAEISERFARMIAVVIEYDNAYRYRFQDMMTETSKWLLIYKPRKEAIRLSKLIRDRDHTHARDQFVKIGKLVSYALMVPKIRRAFDIAVMSTNTDDMKYDEADRYHVLYLGGYDYFGQSDAARMRKFDIIHSTSVCHDAPLHMRYVGDTPAPYLACTVCNEAQQLSKTNKHYPQQVELI